MDASELRAAAERWRAQAYPRPTAGKGADHDSYYLHQQEMADMVALADAHAAMLAPAEPDDAAMPGLAPGYDPDDVQDNLFADIAAARDAADAGARTVDWRAGGWAEEIEDRRRTL